jgi:hypothetical protein
MFETIKCFNPQLLTLAAAHTSTCFNPRLVIKGRSIWHVSIRAPVILAPVATLFQSTPHEAILPYRRSFNPCPARGGLSCVACRCEISRFQSTPPTRGATRCVLAGSLLLTCFNPRIPDLEVAVLPVSIFARCGPCACPVDSFQSTPPSGADPVRAQHPPHLAVSIHVQCVRLDGVDSSLQSTPPRARPSHG